MIIFLHLDKVVLLEDEAALRAYQEYKGLTRHEGRAYTRTAFTAEQIKNADTFRGVVKTEPK